MREEDTGYEPLPEERPGVLSRLVRLNRCFLVLLIIPATAMAWRPPYADLARKQSDMARLQSRRDELRIEVERKQERLELVKTDPSYLEVVARDLLEHQKDGETIIVFKDK